MKLMISIFILVISIIRFSVVQGQDLVSVIDELTTKWDQEATILKTYSGMKEYCRSQPHRTATIELVSEIHHYDSVLYHVVKKKYDNTKDTEALATLKDIKKLEEEYTTSGFLNFLHKECGTFNDIEKNYGARKGKPYAKQVSKLEKELRKYVEEITRQIDIVDEHIHHLKD